MAIPSAVYKISKVQITMVKGENKMSTKLFHIQVFTVLSILTGLFLTRNLYPQELNTVSKEINTELNKMNSSEDPKYLINRSVKQNWNGALWIDAWQYAYEYGSNNKVSSLTYSTWYETNWNYYTQILTIYNEDNKITELTTQRWNGENWLPNSKSSNYYNENKELTEVVNYIYQDRWRESSRLVYTYDTTERITQTNDTINQTTEQITQLWSGYWVDKEKTTTAYNIKGKNSFPLESITKLWYISYWADKNRVLYKYDSLYNLTEHVRQVPGTADWVNEKRNVYKYDGKNMT